MDCTVGKPVQCNSNEVCSKIFPNTVAVESTCLCVIMAFQTLKNS